MYGLVTVFISMLQPMTSDLEALRKELCCGNKEFVYLVDKQGIAMMSHTEAWHGATNQLPHIVGKAVEEVIWQDLPTGLSGIPDSEYALFLQSYG